MSGTSFYIINNTKQKHIREFFLANANILFRYCPHPLRSLILHIHSTHSYTVLDKGENMHMKQSPYQLHPQQFLSSSSSFYIILWCVSNFFAHENKSFAEKYKWASLLLLSEVSISPLLSHSCFHVQELHTTQTDRQTDRHTHTHTYTHTHTLCIFYKNVSIILMFTYEN